MSIPETAARGLQQLHCELAEQTQANHRDRVTELASLFRMP